MDAATSHEKSLDGKQLTGEIWNNCIDGDLWQKKRIFVEIESIENIDTSKVKKISVKVEFKGQTILETENIIVSESKDCIVKASGEIPVDEPSPRLMDDILANPLFFTVFDKTTLINMQAEKELTADLKRESKKIGSRTSLSTKSAIKSANATVTFNVYGICNMDLGPLIKGEKILKENIVMESEKTSSGHKLISWPKLPRMNVIVSVGEELIPSHINKLNNIINVTVESIYNAPSNLEGSSFDAFFMIPSFGEKMETITFSNGILTNFKDGECLKRWLTLSHIEGRGAVTKYKIKPQVCDIINSDDEEINLEKALYENCLRIHWNKWRSSIMVKTGSNFFFRKLSKNKLWPIEIAVISRPSSQKNGKPEKRVKTASAIASVTPQRYIAYLKLGSLLYPGVTRARVAGKLYSYSQFDIIEKCGSDFITSVVTNNYSKTKNGDKVNPPSRKEQEAIFTVLTDNEDVSGSPLYDENGNPVFIVVEVEVWKPYIPKREPEYFLQRFSAYFSPKKNAARKDMSVNIAMNNFIEIIKKLSFTINESYKNFMENEINIIVCDNEDRFFRYLCNEELFQQMKIALEDRILDLVGEKFGDFGKDEEKLPQIFMYIVNEMRKITNSFIYKKKLVKSNEIEAENFQLFAEEALEDGNYDLAKRYLLQKLSINKLNPDYWLDYALYALTLEDNEKAVECIRETLLMDMKHRIGLLLYGLTMARFDEIEIAEITFQVLLAKFPDFIEGWMVFHLFYSRLGYLEGAEFALQMALELECKKSSNESGEDDEKTDAGGATLHSSENELETDVKAVYNDSFTEKKYGVASFSKGHGSIDPLSWTARLVPNLSLCMKTAILLLRLRAFEFANMALSRDLAPEKRGISIQYMYYVAVSHYLRGQYDEAISHLKTAIEEFSENCFLWSLLGHCYFKLKTYDKCIKCFEYTVETYNRPDDIHLIHVRLGMCYIKNNKYHCAKQSFLSACKNSPSSETWLGLGVACYNLTEFEEAEEALTEASFLDCMCPIIWAYLTLCNIQLQRYDIVDLCYTEAKKKNLKDPRLIDQIETLLEVHHLKISH